jgi:type III secretion protein W
MGFGSVAGRPAEGAAEIAAKHILEEKEEELAIAETAEQVETEIDIAEEQETDLADIIGARFAQEQKSIKERPVVLYKVEKPEELRQKVIPDRDVRDQASHFEKRNPELKAQILQVLLSKAKECRDKDELLKLLAEFYPDPSLADEALDFLLATTVGDLKEIVRQAKDALNTQQGREIKAGRNISEEVQKYVTLGLGTPSKLRDLYRDITGNPREPISLFLELGDRFNYKEMRKVLAYLFHALGTDLKSQGPSIPPGFLHRLLSEVRNLQAGLGILQFFKGRMRLVDFLFQKNELPVPETLTFETMSRQFVTLLQERYPTADKVLQLAAKLGIDKELLAKIIVFSQMRDAVREIALFHFYRSIQHRDEIYKAILEALEQLEEELDELYEHGYEEEDEEEGEGKKKGKEQESEEQEEGKAP